MKVLKWWSLLRMFQCPSNITVRVTVTFRRDTWKFWRMGISKPKLNYLDILSGSDPKNVHSTSIVITLSPFTRTRNNRWRYISRTVLVETIIKNSMAQFCRHLGLFNRLELQRPHVCNLVEKLYRHFHSLIAQPCRQGCAKGLPLKNSGNSCRSREPTMHCDTRQSSPICRPADHKRSMTAMSVGHG